MPQAELPPNADFTQNVVPRWGRLTKELRLMMDSYVRYKEEADHLIGLGDVGEFFVNAEFFMALLAHYDEPSKHPTPVRKL